MPHKQIPRPMTNANDKRTAHGAHQLSYEAVAAIVGTMTYIGFLTQLADAIEDVYTDLTLTTIRRSALKVSRTEDLIDTLEVMGCKSHDYSCIKVISSNPSVASRSVPVVTGTLVCTDNDPAYLDQASLLCDTGLITPLRTAASTAVVLRRIRPDVETVGIIGAGLEGSVHAFAIAALLPKVRQIIFTDIDLDRAREAASDLEDLLHEEKISESRDIEVRYLSTSDTGDIYGCDAIVTATYVTSPILERDGLRDGTFIAAVGADLKGKRELSNSVYEAARFVTDDLIQCLTEGELQYAADVIRVRAAEVAALEGHRGQLSEGRIVSVDELLRDSPSFINRSEPLVVYDSTGFSGQDLATARVLISHLDGTHVPLPWNPPRTMTFRELRRAGVSIARQQQ